jgi:hypothetical protein
MRIKDIIYFSPGIKAIDLDFNNRDQILDAFLKRINKYYLEPAIELNQNKQAFAAGVILMTTIDAITNYSKGGSNRIKEFMAEIIESLSFTSEIKKKITNAFDDNFRNGLIHEGRIKNCGQFSYDYETLVKIENEFVVIDPNELLKRVKKYSEKYIEKLRRDDAAYSIFIDKFKRQFESEINRLKKL